MLLSQQLDGMVWRRFVMRIAKRDAVMKLVMLVLTIESHPGTCGAPSLPHSTC